MKIEEIKRIHEIAGEIWAEGKSLPEDVFNAINVISEACLLHGIKRKTCSMACDFIKKMNDRVLAEGIGSDIERQFQ